MIYPLSDPYIQAALNWLEHVSHGVPLIPARYGPIDTSDLDALNTEIERLEKSIAEWSAKKLHGDTHCARNDYIKWARGTVDMLVAFRANLDKEERP